ncbi:tryptophan--tRNA ligase [Nakamurella flava]|uniref:Tryptophan--tRNA ligase n=1 Tax=Nakamurella flava TaxID=2576308 RepID=A0A4U6QMD3_9ACTN|nr:tryptophan--tRNA ligase [Nakamurella flava]TKV61266.1 tryptophan--tRNA ligase [Nakamurella flava]
MTATLTLGTELAPTLTGETTLGPAERVATGDRPTGGLHLGHYVGTLQNRVRLQDLGIPVTVIIADYQVITDRDDIGPLRDRVRTLVAEYLAVGLDPERTVIFPHSAVPALNQLLVPFLSLVSDGELRRNPTVKAEAMASRQNSTSGLLLTYPVHQAADILGCGGTLIPVGKDQLPHLEVARLIARRFNDRYAGGETLFTPPAALLSSAPVVLGTDGAKMSKSRHNSIALGAGADETAAVIRAARTDSERHITFDPARRPQVGNLLTIVGALSDRDPRDVAAEIGDGGAARLKQVTTEVVNSALAPIRARRAELLADPSYLDAVLVDGIAAATEQVTGVLDRVRAAMGMDYLSPVV